MVKKESEIRKTINLFVKALKKEIPIEKVILFGSCANGKVRPDSDIDLIIVSTSFAKGKYIENMQYLSRKAARVNHLIEPIPATPQEINHPDKRTFLGQVIESGKVYK